jgi:hypothetical protein
VTSRLGAGAAPVLAQADPRVDQEEDDRQVPPRIEALSGAGIEKVFELVLPEHMGRCLRDRWRFIRVIGDSRNSPSSTSHLKNCWSDRSRFAADAGLRRASWSRRMLRRVRGDGAGHPASIEEPVEPRDGIEMRLDRVRRLIASSEVAGERLGVGRNVTLYGRLGAAGPVAQWQSN